MHSTVTVLVILLLAGHRYVDCGENITEDLSEENLFEESIAQLAESPYDTKNSINSQDVDSIHELNGVPTAAAVLPDDLVPSVTNGAQEKSTTRHSSNISTAFPEINHDTVENEGLSEISLAPDSERKNSQDVDSPSSTSKNMSRTEIENETTREPLAQTVGGASDEEDAQKGDNTMGIHESTSGTGTYLRESDAKTALGSDVHMTESAANPSNITPSTSTLSMEVVAEGEEYNNVTSRSWSTSGSSDGGTSTPRTDAGNFKNPTHDNFTKRGEFTTERTAMHDAEVIVQDSKNITHGNLTISDGMHAQHNSAGVIPRRGIEGPANNGEADVSQQASSDYLGTTILLLSILGVVFVVAFFVRKRVSTIPVRFRRTYRRVISQEETRDVKRFSDTSVQMMSMRLSEVHLPQIEEEDRQPLVKAPKNGQLLDADDRRKVADIGDRMDGSWVIVGVPDIVDDKQVRVNADNSADDRQVNVGVASSVDEERQVLLHADDSVDGRLVLVGVANSVDGNRQELVNATERVDDKPLMVDTAFSVDDGQLLVDAAGSFDDRTIFTDVADSFDTVESARGPRPISEDGIWI